MKNNCCCTPWKYTCTQAKILLSPNWSLSILPIWNRFFASLMLIWSSSRYLSTETKSTYRKICYIKATVCRSSTEWLSENSRKIQRKNVQWISLLRKEFHRRCFPLNFFQSFQKKAFAEHLLATVSEYKIAKIPWF